MSQQIPAIPAYVASDTMGSEVVVVVVVPLRPGTVVVTVDPNWLELRKETTWSKAGSELYGAWCPAVLLVTTTGEVNLVDAACVMLFVMMKSFAPMNTSARMPPKGLCELIVCIRPWCVMGRYPQKSIAT